VTFHKWIFSEINIHKIWIVRAAITCYLMIFIFLCSKNVILKLRRKTRKSAKSFELNLQFFVILFTLHTFKRLLSIYNWICKWNKFDRLFMNANFEKKDSWSTPVEPLNHKVKQNLEHYFGCELTIISYCNRVMLT